MKNKKRITQTILFTMCFALPFAAIAQDGSLDLTFGSGGMDTTCIGVDTVSAYTGFGAVDEAHAIAIQSDGKIVVAGVSLEAGSIYMGLYTDFALVRYKANGSLDSTFDTDGKVTTSLGANDVVTSLAIQSNGKIIVAGYSWNGIDSVIALVRYNTNGSLDNTFDTDGKVTTSLGGNAVATAVAIQSNGKIIVAGYSWNGVDSVFALVRYNTNGSLDSTFDTDGIVTTDFGVGKDIANALAIQSDGKIVAAGYSWNGADSDFALARYNTNGSLDNTFDIDGRVTTSLGGWDVATALAIQLDGKILVSGYSSTSFNYDFALARYNTTGSLDSSFDADGMVTTDIGGIIAYSGQEFGYALAIQSDGKILVAGSSWYVSILYGSTTVNFALVRYNNNGSLDNTLDTDGIVTTDINGSGALDEGYAIALQSDGRIVVAGKQEWSTSGPETIHRYFAIARYNNSISTGLNTLAYQNTKITMYPNPTTGTIYLPVHANIVLTDLLGNVVIEKENTKQLDLSAQPSGMYLLRIGDNLNDTYKIIKE